MYPGFHKQVVLAMQEPRMMMPIGTPLDLGCPTSLYVGEELHFGLNFCHHNLCLSNPFSDTLEGL